MTISGSLQTALSGLNGQSAAIGFISDNVANATTTGYKKVESRFQTLITQSSAVANTHSPGGAINSPFFANNAQGGIQQVASTTSIAVSGNGFIPVLKKNGENTTTGLPNFENTDYYTRVGDFVQNVDGFLVNSSGYFLQGYALSINSTTNTMTRAATTSAVRVSNLLDSPVPTGVVEYSANLPSNFVDPTSLTVPATLTANSIQVFDALGNPQTLDLVWTREATNSWTLQINANGAVGTQTFGPTTVQFGGIVGAASVTPGTISTLGDGLGGAGTGGITGSVAAQTGDDASFTFSVNFGSGDQAIRLDLGSFGNTAGTTQFAGTNLTLNDFSQNGVPQGNFKSLAIDNDGFVTVTFDNGNVKQFYQVPLAKFRDPTELDRVDGNAFVETPNSGSAVLVDSGTSGAGDFVSAAIEQSNVDIAEEFSKMIVAQRVYSANARLVTVADDLLNETINIKR